MLSILNQRSSTHNSCEDNIYVYEDPHQIYGVIADGCSSGHKSEFASQAICYILKINNILSPTSNHTLLSMKQDLESLKDLLHLDYMDMLSTMILFHYDIRLKILKIRVFGDGNYFIKSNGELKSFNIDQNNTPDYIGYHLDDTRHEFGQYLDKYPEVIYHNVERFILTSDGIKAIQESQFFTPKCDTNILFNIPTSENYLERMWNKLKNNHYTLADDLSIISYVQD